MAVSIRGKRSDDAIPHFYDKAGVPAGAWVILSAAKNPFPRTCEAHSVRRGNLPLSRFR